jgi:hypothetical protein
MELLTELFSSLFGCGRGCSGAGSAARGPGCGCGRTQGNTAPQLDQLGRRCTVGQESWQLTALHRPTRVRGAGNQLPWDGARPAPAPRPAAPRYPLARERENRSPPRCLASPGAYRAGARYPCIRFCCWRRLRQRCCVPGGPGLSAGAEGRGPSPRSRWAGALGDAWHPPSPPRQSRVGGGIRRRPLAGRRASALGGSAHGRADGLGAQYYLG